MRTGSRRGFLTYSNGDIITSGSLINTPARHHYFVFTIWYPVSGTVPT